MIISKQVSLLLCFVLLLVAGRQLNAQDVDTTGVIGFDDVEEEAPINEVALPGWLSIMKLSGRFDVNFEIVDPMENGEESLTQFRNYHKFLFLNVNPNEHVSFEAEVLDLSYYELIFHVSKKYDVRVGKIWVPFGSSPFHHYYGGIQGDPFSGLLVPNVWAEFGGTVRGSIYADESVAVDADVFVIRGFESELGSVLDLSRGGADGNIAIGARTKFGVGGKFSIWGSVMYNRFGEIETVDEDDELEGEVLLWGGDIVTDFGLIDVPLLRDIRMRAAFARAEVKDELLVDPVNSKDFWYYKYGDYVELTHRGYRGVVPRLRYGTIIDFDDTVTNSDSHNWDLALLYRMGRNVLFLAEYQINMEEVNELDNDLARFQIVFEF